MSIKESVSTKRLRRTAVTVTESIDEVNLHTSLATSFRNFAAVKIQFGFSDNFFLSRRDASRFMRARADSITDNSDRYLRE